ncbi:MAG: hypothetical protein LBR65_04095, partial [Culturomica sp.]|jgi:hypothetical protein|nr:hypothetical protein [Culturomica sp.]
VTGLVADSVFKFVDATMFDLNAMEADGETTKYLLPGVSAKIHFNTGNLAGYEFDVHAYDHATHTFTLVKITDERGDSFPSESSAAFQFAVGNEYKLLDVALPPEYEVEAENELANAGETYYDQNCQPKVQYSLDIHDSFLRNLIRDGVTVNIFKPGDYIPIKDADIDVDKSVRIQGFKRDLINEYKYTLTISDTVATNVTNRIISELIDVDKIITINNLKDPARARANWQSSREVLNMVFDPDGDYYTAKIKPESIDTNALSVGAKSMQFGLTNTVFQPNYNGNKNSISVQGGVLTHYTIDENAARSWVLANNTTTFNSDTQAYYIYAKCQRSGTSGTIIFSPDQIKVKQDANFYHFWIGVVNSVNTELNARAVSLSYGFTMVNGGFIKTGRIMSYDGNTWFDLDTSEISGRINFKDGLVSGLIGIGNDKGINAFFNGKGGGENGENLDTDVRIAVGQQADNVTNAPFMVLHDGSFIASKATIEGIIKAISGSIGGFEIGNGRIGATTSGNASSGKGLSLYNSFIKFANATNWASIGENVLPLSSGIEGLARFTMDKSGDGGLASGIALMIRATFPNDEFETWSIRRSIDNRGNLFSIGGHTLFDDKYIGEAYTDVIESYIGIAHSFVFTAISASLLNVRMPTKSQITSDIGNIPVSFLLHITIASGVSNGIRLLSQTDGQIYNNNGGAVSYIDMTQGDTLVLRYYNGGWYQVAARQ